MVQKKSRVGLWHRYSSVVNRKYWANTCGHCHAMFGNHYIQFDLDPNEYEAALPFDAY
jgi:hypothetical protein